MSNHFSYSLLQYTPAEGCGEVLNIGVLLLFPELNRAELLSPRYLGRLRAAFPNAPERLVRGFLRSISNRTQVLSREPEIWSSINLLVDADRFIASHLLIPDASSIRFTSAKTVVRYASPEQVANDYFRLYLSVFDQSPKESRTDEKRLVKRFKQTLSNIHQGLPDLLKQDYELEVQDEKYSFDFSWQNGRQNLVKAISFDVKREETIKRKTERYFGQFTLLQPTVEERNLHFDLLLARPRIRSLFASYDRSLTILSQVPHAKLWEGEAIDQYSQKTAKELLDSV